MSENKKPSAWVVELGRDREIVPAERATVTTSGALVLENGTMLDSSVVNGYAPGEWKQFYPFRHDGECECDDTDEDDE